MLWYIAVMKKILAATVLYLLTVLTLTAMQSLEHGDMEKYKADGTFESRKARVEKIGNHRVHPSLAARAIRKIEMLAGKAGDRTPLPAWQGMPTTGTNEMLVFLIEFPDHPSSNTASNMNEHIFGAGDTNNFPRESLTEYYLRSSYNQLHLQGNCLGWYEMSHDRSWYTNEYGDSNLANYKIVEEVANHFDATHDYSQYDNNGDGKIDYFAVIWTGPDTGWGNFWWGYQWSLSTSLVLDGVQFYDFSWQWESRPAGGDFSPYVLIHETGHALGLPDYYDYDGSIGPDGGVGGLDMMAGNKGDHNSFSKFMLDWMTPMLVNTGRHTKTVRALSEYQDSVAVMPGYDGSTPYNEYFMVENRHRTSNDANMPSDGMLIWHVDATPNGSGNNFLYDNSYTSHKLLRLMEADGLEEIETGNGSGDAGDYYNQGDELSVATSPNSSAYDGSTTYVMVTNISADAASMTADIAADRRYSPTVIVCSEVSIAQEINLGENGATIPVDIWVAAPSETFYTLSDDASWLEVTPSLGFSSGQPTTHNAQFNTAGLGLGSYDTTVDVVALSAENSPFEVAVSARIVGTNLSLATDLTNAVWRTGGNGNWIQQVESNHDGIDAAESGDIDDGEASWIEVDVEGAGDFEFWWKVSSEPGWDYLRLYIDGALQPDSISGDSEWEEVEVTLSGGSHTVRWAYEKDGSASTGSDTAWLDDVRWTPNKEDRDGDGMLDWMEDIAGTDPTNSQSIFEVYSVSRTDDPNMAVLSWQSWTDRIYSVEMATNILSGFTPLVSALPATPPLNVYTASLASTDAAYFRISVSELVSGSDATLVEEYFVSGGTPGGWQVIDEADTGAGWVFNDPEGRGNRTGGTAGFAIADSDFYKLISVRTSLITPSMNCSALSSVTLEFKTDYYSYSGDEVLHVDVVSGASTQTVWSKTSSYLGPHTETVDISAQAAGHSDVTVRFYYEAFYDWWWQIDDVKVSGLVE